MLRTVALGAASIDGVVLDSVVSLQDDDKADLSRRSLAAERLAARYWRELACVSHLGGAKQLPHSAPARLAPPAEPAAS